MKKPHGQSLFEVVIALGVISAVLIALVGLIVTTQRNTNSSKTSFEATKYAQELSEWLRGQRDNSWSNFYTNTANATQCFNSLSWGNVGTCADTEPIANTFLFREATFTRVSDDEIEVSITVRWSDSQGDHSTSANTILTNWRRS